MDLLTRLRSPYLLGLVGYCSDNDHRLLVYEYMANGGLQEHLYPNGGMQILDGSSACCSQCLLSLRDGNFLPCFITYWRSIVSEVFFLCFQITAPSVTCFCLWDVCALLLVAAVQMKQEGSVFLDANTLIWLSEVPRRSEIFINVGIDSFPLSQDVLGEMWGRGCFYLCAKDAIN